MLFLPLQYFIVSLLLLVDCTLEESYFMLVAHIQLLNSLTEVVFVILQLFYASLVLITVVVAMVADTHLNIDS
jgi:hypothetical protein